MAALCQAALRASYTTSARAAFIVDCRLTTLPYLIGLHFALDASLPVLLFMASKGLRIT